MKIKHWLACGAAIIALPTVAQAQQSASTGVESVVVPGSRVISDAANSPTPLTIVSTDDLKATTPTDIPDGLNKLPIFQGSQTIGRPGDGSQNFSSNTLNLRNFGGQRTLVLLDGHRATPSNADGTVDIDTLPQMLVSRVDVVTGGASAVYGSDAVTGVVNFVVNKKFDGLKFDVNSGISTYADAMSYNLGVAAGTDLFGGRGHLEASLEYRHPDPLNPSPPPPLRVLLPPMRGKLAPARLPIPSMPLPTRAGPIPASEVSCRAASRPVSWPRARSLPPIACSRLSIPASRAPPMPMAIPRLAPAISTRAAMAPTTPMARCSTAIIRAPCSPGSAMTWPTMLPFMSRARLRKPTASAGTPRRRSSRALARPICSTRTTPFCRLQCKPSLGKKSPQTTSKQFCRGRREAHPPHH